MATTLRHQSTGVHSGRVMSTLTSGQLHHLLRASAARSAFTQHHFHPHSPQARFGSVSTRATQQTESTAGSVYAATLEETFRDCLNDSAKCSQLTQTSSVLLAGPETGRSNSWLSDLSSRLDVLQGTCYFDLTVKGSCNSSLKENWRYPALLFCISALAEGTLRMIVYLIFWETIWHTLSFLFTCVRYTAEFFHFVRLGKGDARCKYQEDARPPLWLGTVYIRTSKAAFSIFYPSKVLFKASNYRT